MSSTLLRPAIEQRTRIDRLLVTRRDPDTRLYEPMGFLGVSDGAFYFSYLHAVANDPTFRPLPGLSSTTVVHRAEQLFPVFAERIISPRRSDRPLVMDALGLEIDAEPFEVLARSGGRRVGDAIELVPVPQPASDGSITVDFFVHGVRHMGAVAMQRIDSLRDGDLLQLMSEPANPVEPLAVLVTDLGQTRLGYVPSPLLDLVHDLVEPEIRVLRVNPAGVGFHFRLLVRVDGTMTEGRTPFMGPGWVTLQG